MNPISSMPQQVAASVHTLLSDLDDTMTVDGYLPAQSYSVLEEVFRAGVHVIIVTGRPAGWCDMMARFWPVDGVVGENGAFYFSYNRENKTMRRVYEIEENARLANSKRLQGVKERVLQEVPGCAISADQAYRESDLAIDFCEDVDMLPSDSIARIKSIFEEEGATAKTSSIHVNGWFGDYDKLLMTRRLISEILGFNMDTHREKIVFCGDSPNDVPMFRYFPNSCGVANVTDCHGVMEHHPRWLASKRGAEGFAEIVKIVFNAKTSNLITRKQSNE